MSVLLRDQIRTVSGPVAVRLLTKRILGAGPNPEAATDAWRRIEAFFGEHLAAPAPRG